MTASIITLVGSGIMAATAWAGYLKERTDARKLKSKLRRALEDCLAFHDIEHRLCDKLAETRVALDDRVTTLSIKRENRRALRLSGIPTPSGQATPQKLAEALADL